jgi:hypothetical protein
MTTATRFSDEITTAGRVLTRLRASGLRREEDQIPAVEAALDDLERVLDEYTDLSHADINELEPRLRATYRRWLTMARIISIPLDHETTQRAFRVLTEPLPSEYPAALAHLRRLALVVQDVVENCVRGGGP